VDFATGGSVKWLLGGPGAGYLYVREDLDPKMQPAATGWAAHAHPFQFADGAIEYAPDVRRFLNGTPNVPAMYSARSGYEIVNEIGVEAIRVKSERQTQKLIALADESGLVVRSPRDAAMRGCGQWCGGNGGTRTQADTCGLPAGRGDSDCAAFLHVG
jgi:kynureninase